MEVGWVIKCGAFSKLGELGGENYLKKKKKNKRQTRKGQKK